MRFYTNTVTMACTRRVRRLDQGGSTDEGNSAKKLPHRVSSRHVRSWVVAGSRVRRDSRFQNESIEQEQAPLEEESIHVGGPRQTTLVLVMLND